jgi:hypothetical protein
MFFFILIDFLLKCLYKYIFTFKSKLRYLIKDCIIIKLKLIAMQKRAIVLIVLISAAAFYLFNLSSQNDSLSWPEKVAF